MATPEGELRSESMSKYRVHLCRFDSADHLQGKKRTYESVKAAVLEAGRYSIFEATSSRANAKLFTAIDNDPDLEITRKQYPWIEVKRRRVVGGASR
jgi:hypothetical protein